MRDTICHAIYCIRVYVCQACTFAISGYHLLPLVFCEYYVENFEMPHSCPVGAKHYLQHGIYVLPFVFHVLLHLQSL